MTDLQKGQQHVDDWSLAIHQSQAWKDCAIIITYDENCGRWDNVVPPKIDDGFVGRVAPPSSSHPSPSGHLSTTRNMNCLEF